MRQKKKHPLKVLGEFFQSKEVSNYVRTNMEFRNHILPALEKEFPWLHERTGTEEDFNSLCWKHDVPVILDQSISTGVYVLCEGHSFIFLNDKLRGWFLRHVMFHELAHYLFHVPTQSSRPRPEPHNFHVRDKHHFEAEVVSALFFFGLAAQPVTKTNAC